MTSAVLPDVQEQAAQELSDSGKAALVALARGVLKAERYSRRQEVMSSSEQRLCERGHQYIEWNDRSYVFELAKDVAVRKGQSLADHMDVYNIYRPYERSLVAVLSQNPPGINFKPKQIGVPTDVAAAKAAEKMRRAVENDVNMKELQTRVGRLFCTDARVIIWTRTDDEGKVLSSAHGVLETKVPIHTADMAEWTYAVISREIDLDWAKDQHPDVAEKLAASQSTTSDDTYERFARMGVVSGTNRGADYDSHLITEHTVWLRPSRFRKATDNNEAELRGLYPEGVRFTLLGDQCCNPVAESMDTCLAVGFPSIGDGQNRSSLLRDLVPLQYGFNDLMNMIRENLDYSTPATWINRNAVDEEALPEQRAEPGTLHLINGNPNMPLSDNFFQEAQSQLPPNIIEFAQMLQGELAQFITGALPSLFGAGTPDSETASGQAALRDQAMGGLGPAWSAVQWLFAKQAEQGVRAKALVQGQQPLQVESDAGNPESYDPTTVLYGNFGGYPDEDSSFPETTAAKRSQFNTIMTTIAQMQGGEDIVATADNLRLGLELNGLTEVKIQKIDSADKQLREIELLLQQKPVPNVQDSQWQQQAQQAMMSGQQTPSPPLMASIAVDKRHDFHSFELETVKAWLSSNARNEEERKGNTDGVQNVELHCDEHEDALNASQQQATKPPSIAFNGNLLPVEAQAQALAADGIQVDPQSIQMNQQQQLQNKVVEKTAGKPAGVANG